MYQLYRRSHVLFVLSWSN